MWWFTIFYGGDISKIVFPHCTEESIAIFLFSMPLLCQRLTDDIGSLMMICCVWKWKCRRVMFLSRFWSSWWSWWRWRWCMDIFHRWQWAGLVRCGVTRADHPSWSSSIIYTVIVMVIVIVSIMVIIIFGMIITIFVASISLWPSSSRSSSTWSSSTSTTTSSSSSSQVLFLLMRILSYTTTTATPHPLGSFHSALQYRRNIVLLKPRSLSLHCALE